MNKSIYDNFGFVKDVFPELYEKLQEAEKNIYIDYRQAGKNLRECHELLCDYLIKINNVSIKSSNNQKHIQLNDKIGALKKKDLYPVEKDAMISCISNNGKKTSKSYYTYWIKIGNQCSHAGEKDENDPKVCFDSVKELLRIVHDSLKRAFSKQISNIGAFSADRIPIKEYKVCSCRVPIDGNITGCIKEYECIKTNGFGKEKYAIVRIYNANLVDENQRTAMIRDGLTFSEIQDEKGIQFDGNVNINVVSDIDNNNSDFYIVAYEFNKEPIALKDVIRKKYSNEVALKLCLDIAKILREFHSMEMPIYHRNLSFNCVYVCEKNGNLEPSIINLDYAKISSDEYGTVISSVRSAQNMAKQMPLMKYTAPEVRAALMNKNASINIDWSKADIFSLGMLFFDILGKEIADKPVSAALKLQKEGYAPSVTQLVDSMRNQAAIGRPSIDVIIDLLENC